MIEVQLRLTEEEAVLLVGIVRERAEAAERYLRLVPCRNPSLPTAWSRLAHQVARAVAEAANNGTFRIERS